VDLDPADLIADVDELEALYDSPARQALDKELDHLIPTMRAYIDASPLVMVATSGPGGVDCSPRGDAPGFVRVHDDRTLLLPDRRGNNRLDTLRNLVADPRIGLLILVPGVGVTLRVNGTAVITTDDDLCRSFAVGDRAPRAVVVVTIESVYTQCPKAFIRGSVWDPATFRDPAELPSVGTIMAAITNGEFDGVTYDANYPQRVRDTIY